jgi:hypothetical protein
MTSGTITRRGAQIWDFLTTFVAARRTFLSIYRRYERRVIASASSGRALTRMGR